MKISSRFLILTLCGIAGLLVAGLLFFQEMRRQSSVKSVQFVQQYAQGIQQLRDKVDAVQKKMKRNEELIAPIVIAAPQKPGEVPVPVPEVLDKNQPLVLEGIAWSAENPMVMVDGKLYKRGDKIRGATIMQIFQQVMVVRTADGVRQEIPLYREK